MRRDRVGRLILTLLLVTSAVMASAPGSSFAASPGSAQSGDTTLTLYNAQHVALGEAWAADFTRLTGINVVVRSGKDSELANVIIQEGEGSPADVFITENSPAMSAVERRSSAVIHRSRSASRWSQLA